MRRMMPINLTILTALMIISGFLPWGHYYAFDRIGKNGGYEHGIHVNLLFPDWFGDFDVPNYVAIGMVGVAMIGAWLRYGMRASIPLWVVCLPTLYALYHSAINYWYFQSGRAVELTWPIAKASWVGQGGEIGLIASSLAVLVCIGAVVQHWTQNQKQSESHE